MLVSADCVTYILCRHMPIEGNLISQIVGGLIQIYP
jgi:hypothetical protein